jgi:hypothetical protein
MRSLTISDDLINWLDRPTIIKHHGKSSIKTEWSLLIAKDRCESSIISAYHADYVGYFNIFPASPAKIVEAIMGEYQINSVRQSLISLTDAGWLLTSRIDGVKAKDVLKQKTPQKHTLFNSSCEWCLCSTISTHKHHYPVPKSQGGTKTVDICANCHFEFHQLVDLVIHSPSSKLIQFFNTPVDEAKKLLAARRGQA